MRKLRAKRKLIFFFRNTAILLLILSFILQAGNIIVSTSINVVTQTDLVALEEPVSFLFVGGDFSDQRTKSNDWAPHGDAQIVLTLSPENERGNIEVNLVSIPRDTRVPIACNDNIPGKINTALSQGYSTNSSYQEGLDCNVQTVENFLGITIDHYIATGFDGFISIVDAVGGINVNVPYEFCEQDSNDNPDALCFTKGDMLMDGEHALAYARMRHAINPETNTSGDDWERNIRQQEVAVSLANKIINNPSEYGVSAANAVNDSMITNMDLSSMVSFVNFGSQLYNQTMDSLTYHQNIELLLKESDYSKQLNISPYNDLMGIKYDTQAADYFSTTYSDLENSFELDYTATMATPLHLNYRTLPLPTNTSYTNQTLQEAITIEILMTTLDTYSALDGTGDELVTHESRIYYSTMLARSLNQQPDISIPMDYYDPDYETIVFE